MTDQRPDHPSEAPARRDQPGPDEDHDHDHGHDHHDDHHHADDARDHSQDAGAGRLWRRVRHLASPHSHDSSDKVDRQLETSAAGVRTVWWSFVALIATATVQAIVVAASGSVALLGDTLHNLADALTAVPLAFAFVVGRRPPNRRYSYGYGRAEDLAGLAVVVLITLSAAVAAYAAIERLLHPRQVTGLGWVAAAAVVGFVGNEWVAQYRIRVGRQIGSAALVADGLHARTDGFTSLAVLAGVIGVWVGFPAADPIIGLVVTVAILFVLKDAAGQIYQRLMDAVDPTLLEQAEEIVRSSDGVVGVGALRLRWIGHSLRAEVDILVDHNLSVLAAHAIAVEAEHRLIHGIPRLSAATVHADPDGPSDTDHHDNLRAHR
jgi:cation diffusion facilitator family transporter